MLIQAVEAGLPKAAIRLQPIGDVLQGRTIEPTGSPLRRPSAGDQSGTLQHLEVLRDRRLADVERLLQLLDRGLSQSQPSKDRSAGGIGESGERGTEVIGRHRL